MNIDSTHIDHDTTASRAVRTPAYYLGRPASRYTERYSRPRPRHSGVA